MRKLPGRIWRTSNVLSGLVLLAACQTTPTTETTDDVCLIWTPQEYSAKEDSKRTVDLIREKNAVRDAYCKG